MRKEYDRRKKWYRSILSLCLVVALVSSSILPQIQNTYVVQAQEESTLQDSGAADVSAENSVSQTSQEEQTAEPEKAANILEYQDTEDGWSLTITGKNDFSEGQTAFIDGIDDPDKVENYITSLNKDVFAIDKKKVTDYKFPVDISILDKEGKAVENFGEATVRMGRSDCHELDGYELYHLIQNPKSEEDGQWEKIDFKTYDATETESSYVEFSVKSFSPFVWVKTEVIEEETVESDDTESDNTEEPSALAATTEEENSDEENIATTADEQQLYAILYENGNLHFQYGDTPDSSKGNVVKTYLVKDSYATPNQIPWDAERNSIVSVTSDSVVGTGSMRAWFYGCSHLTKVDLSNFDTSNVTNMEKMFYECSALTELDVSNFNTSNVTDMGYMFSGCRSLTELDVSNFDTSNVTNMNNMFYGCRTLTELDVSKFNTSKITGIYYMFYSCSKLKKLDVSNFDTSNFTKLFGMFGYCEALTELDVSNFNTSNVTDMGYMFCSCSSLIELDVSNFNTSNVTEMYRMFDGCSALTELDVSKFDTGNVTKMNNMFDGCRSLTELNLSNFDTSNVTNMTYMFYKCTSLREIVLGKKWKFYGSTDYLPVAEWMNKSTREIYPSLWTQYDGSTMAGVYITKFICKFDANGGMWDKTIECYSNYRLGSDVVISDPVRLGYVFAGWYDAQTGGVKLNENDCVEKDIYYAHWIPNNYKLILRSNGTKEPDIEISMKYDSFYQLSEDLFHREGYVLSGWNDRRNGSGKSYPANESVGNLESVENGEYILYAQWTKESKYATISFETDGGSAVNSYKVLKGSELGEIPTTSKENYTFINWHLNSLKGAVPDKTTVINKDVILYAEFMKDPIVTFVSGIGTDKQRRVKYNQKVGTLPVCGQNDNRYKTFGGWFTEENGGGTQVTKDTIVTMDVTYYAYWGWAPKFRTNGGRIVSSPYPEGYPLQNDSSYIIDKLP